MYDADLWSQPVDTKSDLIIKRMLIGQLSFGTSQIVVPKISDEAIDIFAPNIR